MAFYDIDLTTRMGAQSAADQGGIACFVYAGMSVLGGLLMGASVGFSSPVGIGMIAGSAVSVVLAIAAGIRLRAGKGLILGILVAVLMAVEIVIKALNISIGGVIISGVVLIVLVNGLRGALALHRGTVFEGDEAEVFY